MQAWLLKAHPWGLRKPIARASDVVLTAEEARFTMSRLAPFPLPQLKQPLNRVPVLQFHLL